MILILADAFDIHADSVVEKLSISGENYARLDLDTESLRRTLITGESSNWRVEQGHTVFDCSSVRAVWARRLTVSETLEQKLRAPQAEYAIWKGEWNRHLFGLYACLRTRSWINPILTGSLCDNKLYQFEIATDVGFRIPEYTCSNDKNKLRTFISQHDQVAVKFLSQETYLDEDSNFVGIYVNKISIEDMESFNEHGENPILLQKYINKKFEVRYTFVDGIGYCCRIDSQNSAKSSVDWRRYDLPFTPHSQIETPDHIASMAKALMDRLGLVYGAFDFIVDENDDWWYLEVNSAGQWLWIEDLTGLPISAAVADALIRRSGRAL